MQIFGALALLLCTASAKGLWESKERRLWYNGSVFQTRGTNWHGADSPDGCNAVHGLWARPLDWWIDTLVANGFNAVRVPVSSEVVEDSSTRYADGCVGADPSLVGLTVWEVLERLADLLWDERIFTLWDRHRTRGAVQPYPWVEDWPSERGVAAWVNFLSGPLGTHPSTVGADLLNEPHGYCTLSEAVSYYQQCVTSVEAETNFTGLYFLEGVQWSEADGLSAGWGGDLSDLTVGSRKVATQLEELTHPNEVCLTGDQ
jgi:aryl-phospho-beta-D-glucosidase BglC (GH1 family)